ncbi:DUF5666 domain-containing protein [Thermus hydrothermalis]|uniref:DUF5666 domain-containing protein n=1 Tax=Thermus hydrothermalis TaxID=2908148 RepID=UPI001FA9E30B|nr:DUF5666 domain-containing protein [Thermus hydrothermalis]
MRWKALLALAALLSACQVTPQTGQGQALEALGVLGGTEAQPTLLGKPLDLSGASLAKEGEAFSGTLLPGMVVQVKGEDTGTRIRVEALEVQVELRGPVANVDLQAGTLVVLGQTVYTDANTRIYEKAPRGYRTLLLSDLRVGDYVEVQGTATDTGILATYVERYPAPSSQVETEGRVQGLKTEAKTFTLNGFTVNYAQARVEGTPQDGVWAEVKGTLSGTTILATKVAFKGQGQSGFGTSRRVELEGPIANLDEAAMTFSLLGYTVDFSRAQVVGNLTEGSYVEAKGQVDGNDPTLLHAQLVKVKYPKTRAPKAEAKGQVTALDPEAMTLALGSLAFYADQNTLVKRDDPDGPMAFGEIQVGDYVDVAYDPATQDAEGRFYALRIEVKGATGSEEGEWEGPVQNVDSANYSFGLLGYTVVTDASTQFEANDQTYDQAGFFALIRVGDWVEVKGTLSGTALQAREVELKGRR